MKSVRDVKPVPLAWTPKGKGKAYNMIHSVQAVSAWAHTQHEQMQHPYSREEYNEGSRVLIWRSQKR